MSTFFAGWFRRAAIGRLLTASHPALPQQQCAAEPSVEVQQDGNYIIVDGLADATSLQVQHQPGNALSPYDDQILIRWQSNGVACVKSFGLYKYVEQGDQRRAVKNVEYLEVSGGSGRNRYWTQSRLSSYLPSAKAS
ncbi:hypothetical protein [Anatilimnocola floriformis]|uniref:hypothetical protein n=1 Tax=Anatilimnocola floriformis TaxID=2948575 RepID=UPI0020C41204|nr:hypothetical protein [Anatilimnocola floriformis]